MKRLVIGLVIGVLGGAIAGFALGIFVYPYWFLRGEAQESLAAGVARTALAAGTFIHVNTRDPVHWGKGGVTLYDEGADRAVVRLEPDFEVGPGPRFHVYLASRAEVASRADFEAAERIDLGRLRAFKGSQVYAVPPGADLARFASVVIWCKEFDVLISPARLARK
jgi:hypothetical protein